MATMAGGRRTAQRIRKRKRGKRGALSPRSFLANLTAILKTTAVLCRYLRLILLQLMVLLPLILEVWCRVRDFFKDQ
jgi:hypothetical protein